MGRAPCCDKANVKKGPWSPEEDAKLKEYMDKNGTVGNWITLPQKAGLRRCGKSCRLRWLNYLRPNIRHGDFSDEEDRIICTLFAKIGSRWSIIAAQLPGRTDNDIKNYWNTKLKKKLFGVVQSQRETHQIQHTSFSSLLQSSSTSPSPSPSSSTLLYNCGNNTYQAPPTSFSSFEPSYLSCFEFEPSSSSSFPNNSAPSLESDESVLGLIQHILLEEGSCSTSSDGSFSNQFNHGKELECSNNGDHQQIGIQSYNNFHSDVSRMLMSMASDGDDGLPVHQKSSNGLRAETERTPILDYGIEEIKQLISSTPSTCNTFLFDENKADEKLMYYY